MTYNINNSDVSESKYKINIAAQSAAGVGSALEKIASSYTRLPENVSRQYNVDNCSCPSCGCLQGNLLLILSPAGIASATTIAVSMSAIE